MIHRREFIRRAGTAALALATGNLGRSDAAQISYSEFPGAVILSTWDFGREANKAAWEVLEKGGLPLDAVEEGIKVIEADPENHSVGVGGYPDRDGMVTLDASIMDHQYHVGSVTFLQHILHPISVARKVMEKTPHVMLSGEGALRFALEQGFSKQELLTEDAREAWEEWKKNSLYKPVINFENHDTIGLLVMDQTGRLSGGCSTSGLAYKMHGRVGDSPITGAGLYVDGQVGAAVATGLGELVMRSVGSFLTVELMRQGMHPREACRQTINRIVERFPEVNENQVAIIALRKDGETGGYAIHPGFTYASCRSGIHEIIVAQSFYIP
jgi:L-asparaginase/N4-(beta-N-acetylglucosaminyl)-L-asparaginase